MTSEGNRPAKPFALRGAAARAARTMESSLRVPTATSVRVVSAAALVENYKVINSLRRNGPGRITLTHLVAYAVVRALDVVPSMNCAYRELPEGPAILQPDRVNLAVLADVAGPDGRRRVKTPTVHDAQALGFAAFAHRCDALLSAARDGHLRIEDSLNATIALTNPGVFGTGFSVPRLTQGPGALVGIGELGYPAAFRGMGDRALARLAVGRTLTITSTYDHRVIQGAQSGRFLGRIGDLLGGADDFYEDIFRELDVRSVPVRWARDLEEADVEKVRRIRRLINAYREYGYVFAARVAKACDAAVADRARERLAIEAHGLTLWDLGREFTIGPDESPARLRDVIDALHRAYCGPLGADTSDLRNAEQQSWIRNHLETEFGLTLPDDDAPLETDQPDGDRGSLTLYHDDTAEGETRMRSLVDALQSSFGHRAPHVRIRAAQRCVPTSHPRR